MANKPKYNPDDVERWVTVRGARIPIMKDGSFGVGEKATESDVQSVIEKITSRNDKYDTTRSKGKAKNNIERDKKLWMEQMTSDERKQVLNSMDDPQIKQAVIDNRLHGEEMESVLGKLFRALKNGGNIRQLPKNVKNLKKGEYFTKKDISDPKESQVWVRGDWSPSAKAYICYKFGDVNSDTLLKSDAEVYTDFYF